MASPETFIWGILLVVVGAPCAIWPYKAARFEEQLDSIGSKRSWSQIEPAKWKITYTRVAGFGMAILGIGLLLVS